MLPQAYRAIGLFVEDAFGLVPVAASLSQKALKEGGERAAAMYGLIGAARLNGVDPEVRLRHVLTHIADRPIDLPDDFLP